MKNAINQTRATINRITEIWSDRDVHIPALKKGIRSVPSKFRAAEPDQRRNIIIAVGAIVVIQFLLLTKLI